MNKYKIILEYDGTSYSGWQMQKNARSIQGTLMDAAQKFLNMPTVSNAHLNAYHGGGEEATQTERSIRRGADGEACKGRQTPANWLDIQGAGRTDAGVHALGQTAHLECAHKLDCETLRMGLNDRLPANINILSVQNAPPRFHARHSAVSRSYLYLIAKRRTAFGKKYVWWIKDKLHTDKMQKALSVFKGFHDFTSFADKRMEKNSSTKVLVESIELKEFNSMIAIRITGSHFLWKMVRRIVGMTVEAGRGNISARELEQMLVADSDVPARHTAPPSGLFLEKVLYEGDKLPPIQPPILFL
ncbi:MAG: tRNA pseudouridine(38-40) synthase TruA [Deltaproteobacteria bacterium HGW-Deltaproteobacteria-9]|nr:MAG: tRNA pseudouridine(38-40) synthase TruA [Deltaproteobacteria bacterium HGW-Deltaproteobacteria-9]